MRPGRTLYRPGDVPAGWISQPKWNDERCLWVARRAFNRQGIPFDLRKIRQFTMPDGDEDLDLLLIGFRTGSARRVVILDRPYRAGGYLDRNPDAEVWTDPVQCWNEHRGNPEVEGIVARHPDDPYCFGTCNRMFKCKW